MEDENEEAERSSRELHRARERLQYLRRSTISPVANQYRAPSASHAASPAAQQQRSRYVRSTSRKPANCNTVAVYAALAPAPATVVLRRQPSSLASYRQWVSERQRLATGSLSARLRPTRFLTPQGHKGREQRTVEQPKKPTVMPAPAKEPVRLPGNAPEPSRRV